MYILILWGYCMNIVLLWGIVGKINIHCELVRWHSLTDFLVPSLTFLKFQSSITFLFIVPISMKFAPDSLVLEMLWIWLWLNVYDPFPLMLWVSNINSTFLLTFEKFGLVWFLFYGPSTHFRSFRARSVNLATLFLGKPPRQFTYQYLVQILSPVTDNCSSWISGRGRMAVEMFSWPSLHERMCRTWGSNSGPLACQANSLPFELPRPVYLRSKQSGSYAYVVESVDIGN